jgi:hypothetical protein
LKQGLYRRIVGEQAIPVRHSAKADGREILGTQAEARMCSIRIGSR